jgi:hypothetical protein
MLDDWFIFITFYLPFLFLCFSIFICWINWSYLFSCDLVKSFFEVLKHQSLFEKWSKYIGCSRLVSVTIDLNKIGKGQCMPLCTQFPHYMCAPWHSCVCTFHKALTFVILVTVFLWILWLDQLSLPHSLSLILLPVGYVGVGSKMGPLGTSATEWPIIPDPGDYGDGEFGEMKTGRENRSTRRKPAPAPLRPPQIPFDQTRVWTRATAVRSQRLTAWAMARPLPVVTMVTGFQ